MNEIIKNNSSSAIALRPTWPSALPCPSVMRPALLSDRFRIVLRGVLSCVVMPSLALHPRGGSRIFIGEGLQVLKAPFCWRKGCRICLKGRSHVRKRHPPFLARRVPLLAKGTPYLLTGRPHERKGAFSCQRGASFGGKGVVTAQKGAIVGENGAFSYQKGAFACRKSPI